jgi:hypothetical protein
MSGSLVDILNRLSENNVDFVIIGGFAAVTHGSTMVTHDLDICCEFSADNLSRLQNALADLHPVHRLTRQKLPLIIKPESCSRFKNLYLETDFGILDCLGSVLGIGKFKKVKESSVLIETPGRHAFRVMSIDALIKAKKAMHRPKDIETVIQLQTIRSSQH